MDGTVVAAGNEEIAHAIERQPAGIHQRSDKRLDAVIRSDLVKRNGNTLAPRTGKRDVNVAVQIDRGVRDRMKVVRDLQADVYGMGLAFVAGGGDAHHSAVRTFRNARHQTILTGESNAGFSFPEAHHRTRLRARDEITPMNGNLSARNGRRGRNSLNVWNAVFFCRRPEPEFHTRPM